MVKAELAMSSQPPEVSQMLRGNKTHFPVHTAKVVPDMIPPPRQKRHILHPHQRLHMNSLQIQPLQLTVNLYGELTRFLLGSGAWTRSDTSPCSSAKVTMVLSMQVINHCMSMVKPSSSSTWVVDSLFPMHFGWWTLQQMCIS